MNADEGGSIKSVTFTISWSRGRHQKMVTLQCQDQDQLPVQFEKTSLLKIVSWNYQKNIIISTEILMNLVNDIY